MRKSKRGWGTIAGETAGETAGERVFEESMFYSSLFANRLDYHFVFWKDLTYLSVK
jgi:hypothetical protein